MVIDGIGVICCWVSDMLDRVRQERDIIKVNCLNDKLTQRERDGTATEAREAVGAS